MTQNTKCARPDRFDDPNTVIVENPLAVAAAEPTRLVPGASMSAEILSRLIDSMAEASDESAYVQICADILNSTLSRTSLIRIAALAITQSEFVR